MSDISISTTIIIIICLILLILKVFARTNELIVINSFYCGSFSSFSADGDKCRLFEMNIQIIFLLFHHMISQICSMFIFLANNTLKEDFPIPSSSHSKLLKLSFFINFLLPLCSPVLFECGNWLWNGWCENHLQFLFIAAHKQQTQKKHNHLHTNNKNWNATTTFYVLCVY